METYNSSSVQKIEGIAHQYGSSAPSAKHSMVLTENGVFREEINHKRFRENIERAVLTVVSRNRWEKLNSQSLYNFVKNFKF